MNESNKNYKRVIINCHICRDQPFQICTTPCIEQFFTLVEFILRAKIIVVLKTLIISVTIYDDNAAHPWGTPSDSDEFRCNLLLESLQEELTGAQ